MTKQLLFITGIAFLSLMGARASAITCDESEGGYGHYEVMISSVAILTMDGEVVVSRPCSSDPGALPSDVPSGQTYCKSKKPFNDDYAIIYDGTTAEVIRIKGHSDAWETETLISNCH